MVYCTNYGIWMMEPWLALISPFLMFFRMMVVVLAYALTCQIVRFSGLQVLNVFQSLHLL